MGFCLFICVYFGVREVKAVLKILLQMCCSFMKLLLCFIFFEALGFFTHLILRRIMYLLQMSLLLTKKKKRKKKTVLTTLSYMREKAIGAEKGKLPKKEKGRGRKWRALSDFSRLEPLCFYSHSVTDTKTINIYIYTYI